MWNPSNRECECDKSCGIGEYLDYKSCTCRKCITDKLVEECTNTIEESNDTLVNSSDNTLYFSLFLIFLLLFLIMIGVLIYFYWYKTKNTKFDLNSQTNYSEFDLNSQTNY